MTSELKIRRSPSLPYNRSFPSFLQSDTWVSWEKEQSLKSKFRKHEISYCQDLQSPHGRMAQCAHLQGGMIKNFKVSGKNISFARRYEWIIDIVITQGDRVLFQALEWHYRVEVRSGVAETTRIMKKFETSITRVKVEHFAQYINQKPSEEDILLIL